MPLSPEELAYDRYVTVGRMLRDNVLAERGIILGILLPYLNPADVDAIVGQVDRSDRPHFDSYVAEGSASQRNDYTAEELFVWAWEYAKCIDV